MQQFERDKFSILEQSDTRFSFEQDIDLKHSVRSRKKSMLYLEVGIGVLIVAMIAFHVAWTITSVFCVIAVILAFLSNIGQKWISEGASCTKVDISKHKSRMKIATFQRDEKGQIWHDMAREHLFDIACLGRLEIKQGNDLKKNNEKLERSIEDDVFVLSFTASDHNVPVILYMASSIQDVQQLKDQLELFHVTPYQVALV